VIEAVVIFGRIVIGTLAEQVTTEQLFGTRWFFKQQTGRPQVVVSVTIDRATISLVSRRR